MWFVFLASFLIFSAVALRLKQSKIVSIGGGFIAALVIPLVFGMPDRNVNRISEEGAEKLASKSDDFMIHKESFIYISKKLIDKGTCTADDFNRVGGWLKSLSHKDRDVYFIYCGGMDLNNKIYIDATSREIFR